MPKKNRKPEDKLFDSASPECQRLHAAAKKALREKKRKEWWRKYGGRDEA